MRPLAEAGRPRQVGQATHRYGRLEVDGERVRQRAGGVLLHCECQIVVALPSRTLAAGVFSRAVSWSDAAAVQPARLSVGLARPSRLISAALDHGPRLPASVSAVSRTNRAIRGSKVTVCAVLTSAKLPVAAAAPHVAPSVLVSMRYCPMVPLRLVPCRGR